MATFKVRMTYVGYHTYEVKALSAQDAQDIAMDKAHCEDFTSGTFEVEGVKECEDMSLPE